MKPLLVLGKIFFVGCLWSIFFIEGIRVILLINWHFDIFWPPHWVFLWQTWHAGWVIRHAKEWAFILILLAAIPMWLTGWIALSVINWTKLFNFVLINPVKRVIAFIRDLNAPIRNELALKKVVKKKSYKEIRPNAHNMPVETFDINSNPVTIKTPVESQNSKPIISKPAKKATEETEKKPFTHSVFEFDDDDDDFDLDFDTAIKTMSRKATVADEYTDKNAFDSSYNDDYDEYEEEQPSSVDIDDDYDDKPRRSNHQQRDRSQREDREHRDRNSRNRNDDRRNSDKTERKNVRGDNRRAETNRRSDSNNPIVETLRQKGYEIINGVNIKNTYVDYVAVSDEKLYLCLVDKETGDWLADEERFNDEEPLWFSESSHRVSPVRMVDIARNILAEKLDDSNMIFDIRAYVVVQSGNIINAEDMFEIWNQHDVTVARINRGAPKELPLFSKSVEEIDERIDNVRFENLKKLIRSIK